MLQSGADWLQFGTIPIPPLLRQPSSWVFMLSGLLASCSWAYLDCHLTVTNPLDYVEPLGTAGASGFTFHIEASRDNWKELVQLIKSNGMRPGVSLKPGMPLEDVYPLLSFPPFRGNFSFGKLHSITDCQGYSIS